MLLVDGKPAGTAIAGGNGTFSSPLGLPELPPGRYAVTASCGTELVTAVDLVVSTVVNPETTTLGRADPVHPLGGGPPHPPVHPRSPPWLNGTRPAPRCPTRGGAVLVAATTVARGCRARGPASAAGAVDVDAVINGKAVSSGNDRHPVRLEPDTPMKVELTVRNRGTKPVSVRTVRLEGRAVGLAFFAYDTSVGVQVAGGCDRAPHLPARPRRAQGPGRRPHPRQDLRCSTADRHVMASQMP